MKTSKLISLLLALFLFTGMLWAGSDSTENSSSSSSSELEPEPTPDADKIWRIEDVPAAANPWERFKDHQKLSIYGDVEFPEDDFEPYIIPYNNRANDSSGQWFELSLAFLDRILAD